jgi:hypothetical protein
VRYLALLPRFDFSDEKPFESLRQPEAELQQAIREPVGAVRRDGYYRKAKERRESGEDKREF